MNIEQLRNILTQKHLLKELAKTKSRYRKDILKKADPNLILAICESIYNLLEGRVKLNSSQKELLNKDKFILRKLIQKTKISDKRKLLLQKGGFLPILLPAVLTTLASVVSSFISNK
jgi:hypothetical protein